MKSAISYRLLQDLSQPMIWIGNIAREPARYLPLRQSVPQFLATKERPHFRRESIREHRTKTQGVAGKFAEEELPKLLIGEKHAVHRGPGLKRLFASIEDGGGRGIAKH